MSDYRDYKETVTRPFHIQTGKTTDAYRDGWERIFGKKEEPRIATDDQVRRVFKRAVNKTNPWLKWANRQGKG